MSRQASLNRLVKHGIAFVATMLLSRFATLADSTGATGDGQPYSNLKPTLTLRYLLCMQGAYPGQSDGTLLQSDRSVPMVGEIRVVAFSNTPSGFAECSGQIVGISQNLALFSIFYTNYGGNGVSTFAFPDLRGTVPIGAGQGPLLPNYAVGQRTGTETVTLNIANLPFHRHPIPSGQTGTAGSTATYSILQPSLALNFCIDANGEIMLFAGSTPPYGWAFCDGSLRQITNENDSVLYNYIGTTYGGDGVTTFALPDFRGRSPVGTGNNAVSGNYALAQQNGASTITLFPPTMATHNHLIPGGSTGNYGSSASFDNRQPTLAMTWLIAYSGNSPNSGNGPPFYGEMRLVAGAAPPSNSGWIPATGIFLPIASYIGLFSTISTNYGGNGVSSFAVPNLNGRIAASVGNSFSTLGVAFDQYSVALTVNTIPSHTHALPVAPRLTNLQRYPNGAFEFYFTNVPNNTFTVVTATNVDWPFSNWIPIASITNFTAGYYQFTSAPTQEANRLYAVRLP